MALDCPFCLIASDKSPYHKTEVSSVLPLKRTEQSNCVNQKFMMRVGIQNKDCNVLLPLYSFGSVSDDIRRQRVKIHAPSGDDT